ncbi:hypothetical protein [Kutzneria buriramensis]|uniref:Cytochrome c n=1 Tax=Kutzneria buriramensis TaxID=1045776 RepID=A0A3E0G7U1_9PSEU|nr:hypothetical protein [Kutzneria buriramensis]REH18036.1 hypothetical protein BCF44_13823 [Kutzneria buriramensis]
MTDDRETSRRPRSACALTRGGALTEHDKRALLAFMLSLKTPQPTDRAGTAEIPADATENAPADSAGSGAAAASEPSSTAPGHAAPAAGEQIAPQPASLADRRNRSGDAMRDSPA